VLRITDGTNVVFESYAGDAATAINTTIQFSWIEGGVPKKLGATTDVHCIGALPLGGIVVGGGYVISSVSVSKGANTDYGKASLYFEKLA
jgi:hypothetical protein